MSDAAPGSDADFLHAQKAVALGWLTPDQVESGLKSYDRSKGTRLLAHLSLTPEQIRQLEDPRPIPPEVAEAMKKPEAKVGRYWNVKHVASGGMGMVFRAWDPELHRWVALKLLKQMGDETARAYFHREAQLAAALSHPNIAAIYEVGEHEVPAGGASAGKMPFIAMQFIEGQTLGAAKKRMTFPQIAKAMKDAAEAVDYAHRQGVVHRDLKPVNLMIDKEGRVYVMDFGLAKQTEVEGLTAGLSGSNVILGTPAYMSPEQARGNIKLVDRSSDVYSLGATLYELVTGRPPFPGESQAEILVKVLQDDPAPPRRLLKDVPADLETIALKCLEKEKERRYAGAKELADDLQRYLNNEPILAHPPSLIYRAGKRVRKNPIGAGLAALLLLVLPAGGYWVRRAIRDARERKRVEEENQRIAEENRRKEEQLKAQGGVLGATQAAFDLWKSLDPLLKEAEMRSRAGENEEARRILQDAVKTCDRSLAERETAHAHLFRARILAQMGREAETRREIDLALKIDPQLAEARHERGLLRMREYARSMEQAKVGFISLNMKGAASSESGAAKGAPGEKKESAGPSPETKATPEKLEAAFPKVADLRRQAEEDLSVAVQASSFIKPSDLLVGLAELARLRGKFDEAARQLEAAAAQDPASEAVLLSRARLAQSKGDLKAALEFARQAAQRHKGLAEAPRLIADLLIAQGESSKDERQKAKLFESAQEAADRAVALDAQDARNWETRSDVRSKLAELQKDEAQKKRLREQSLADIESAIKLEPGEVRFYIDRASRHWDLFAQAFDAGDRALRPDAYHADYEEVLRLQPNHPLALGARAGMYLGMAEILSTKDRFDDEFFQKALSDLDRFAAQFPNDATPYSYRGSVHRRRGDAQALAGLDPTPSYERAIEDYGRAIERNRNLHAAWYNRAIVRETLSERLAEKKEAYLKQALEDFRGACATDPKSSDAVNHCGIDQYRLAQIAKEPAQASGLMGQAEQEFHKACDLRPDWAQLWVNRALAVSWKAEYDRRQGQDARPLIRSALEPASQAVLLDSTTAGRWLTRAQIWKQLAEEEKARGGAARESYLESARDYACALALNKDDPQALRERAEVYLGLAEIGPPARWIEKALEDRTAVVRVLPYNFDAVTAQAKCWLDRARLVPQEAVACYRKACALYSKAIPRLPHGERLQWWRGLAAWNLAVAERTAGLDAGRSYEQSVRDLTEFLKVESNPEAFENLMKIFLDWVECETSSGRDPAKRYAQWLAALDAAMKREPKNPRPYIWRANIRQTLGIPLAENAAKLQFRMSIVDASRAIDLGANTAEVYSLRGVSYTHLGSRVPSEDREPVFRAAVKDFSKAIELDPKTAKRYRDRSRSYLWIVNSSNDPAEERRCAESALKDARSALDLEKTVESYEYFGQACESLGDHGDRSAYKEALEAYQAAAKLDPNNATYAGKIAELRQKVKQP